MSVKLFDSLEEMFADIEKGMEEANSSVRPFQEAIKPGDFYARWEPNAGVMIYGEIIDPLQWYHDQPKPWDHDLEEEYGYDKQMWDSYRMRHMRYTKSYSVMCPDGEPGSVHVAVMHAKLNREQFEFMRRCNWPESIAKARLMLQTFKTMN